MSLIFSFVFLWEKGREALRCWLWESGKISWRVGLRVSPYLETLYPVSSSVFLCFSVCLPPRPIFSLYVKNWLCVCMYIWVFLFLWQCPCVCEREPDSPSPSLCHCVYACLFIVHTAYFSLTSGFYLQVKARWEEIAEFISLTLSLSDNSSVHMNSPHCSFNWLATV